jgi:hypothetical protein
MHRVSTNMDQLQKLDNTADEYLLHNFKWKVQQPDIPNRVHLEFETIEEAMAVHHELWKLHVTPLFKNWI